MPNKDLIKKHIFSLLLATYGLWAQAVHAQPDESMDLNSRSPCVGWESEPDRLVVGYLCVVASIPGDERPRYVQNLASVVYKFLFSPGGLALVVEPAELEKLRYDKSKREDLLSQLSEDRIAIWHNDAIYWWNWLESTNKPWERERES
jgi:hypothetical protein